MGKKYIKSAYAPTHPGKILKDGFVDEYGVSITDFAKVLGISREMLSRILNGHLPIVPNVALRISAVVGNDPREWLNMQSKYDAYFLENNVKFQTYSKKAAKFGQLVSNDGRKDGELRKLVNETSTLMTSLKSRKDFK